jgi:Protein of unknown function (DUF3500)
MAELTMADLAAAMRAAVRSLFDCLDSEQRRHLVFSFDGDMHKRWTNFPGQRPGLRLGELSEEQLEPALELLRLVHSVRGRCDTQLVIRICRSSRPVEPAVIRTGTCRTGWWCWEIRRAAILGLADQRPPPAGAGHSGRRLGQHREMLAGSFLASSASRIAHARLIGRLPRCHCDSHPLWD